eukprot:14113878-Alexandrium_andersonii.AAC.1
MEKKLLAAPDQAECLSAPACRLQHSKGIEVVREDNLLEACRADRAPRIGEEEVPNRWTPGGALRDHVLQRAALARRAT